MKRVLILCTGNSARSQMAEGLLRHDAGTRFSVESAGTRPGIVRPEAIAVMRELGIDIAGHRSKSVTEFEGQPFDVVITVCDNARESCPVFFGGSEQRHHDFEDPAAIEGSDEVRLAAFRRVRDQLRAYLRDFAAGGDASTVPGVRSRWRLRRPGLQAWRKSSVRPSARIRGLDVDISSRLSHPTDVRAALRQIIVLAVIAAAVAGDLRLCAWNSTPEARMDCCQVESDCPMHGGQKPPDAQSKPLSQAQADACCAMSEQGSSSSTSRVNTVQQPALLVSIAGAPAVVPVPASPGESRQQPLATNSPPIARHLLLSVIIV